MLDLINEIEQCVKSNNLRCALGMALTLPDICGKIEFCEKASKDRYESWCQEYLFNQGYLPSHDVDPNKPQEEWGKIRAIEPDMCYKLRCAFLHSGNLELNQKSNDNFPLFKLHVSSSKENGIYSSIIERDENQNVREITLDIRLLTKVLCNAAKEYYDNHCQKTAFKDHNIRILDVEKEAQRINARQFFGSGHLDTNNLKDFDKLSQESKIVLGRIQNGEQKAIAKELEKDSNILFAVNELIEGGYLSIPPNEDKFN